MGMLSADAKRTPRMKVWPNNLPGFSAVPSFLPAIWENNKITNLNKNATFIHREMLIKYSDTNFKCRHWRTNNGSRKIHLAVHENFESRTTKLLIEVDHSKLSAIGVP